MQMKISLSHLPLCLIFLFIISDIKLMFMPNGVDQIPRQCELLIRIILVRIPVGEGTSFNRNGTFLRLQIYERVGILLG